jgi:hypothetical protein
VVLFDDDVEVFALPHLDVGLVLGVVAVDGRSVGAALVDRDLLGFAVPIDRASKKAARRRQVSVSRSEAPISCSRSAVPSTTEYLDHGSATDLRRSSSQTGSLP